MNPSKTSGDQNGVPATFSLLGPPPMIEFDAGGLRFYLTQTTLGCTFSCTQLQEYGRGATPAEALDDLVSCLRKLARPHLFRFRKFPKWVRDLDPMLSAGSYQQWVNEAASALKKALEDRKDEVSGLSEKALKHRQEISATVADLDSGTAERG